MVDVGIFFPTHRDTDLFRHSLEYLNDFFLFVLLDFYENRILQRLDEYADVGETKKNCGWCFSNFYSPHCVWSTTSSKKSVPLGCFGSIAFGVLPPTWLDYAREEGVFRDSRGFYIAVSYIDIPLHSRCFSCFGFSFLNVDEWWAGAGPVRCSLSARLCRPSTVPFPRLNSSILLYGNSLSICIKRHTHTPLGIHMYSIFFSRSRLYGHIFNNKSWSDREGCVPTSRACDPSSLCRAF